MPDLNKIIEDLSSLSVAEAAELSKQLEEKWGINRRMEKRMVSKFKKRLFRW